MLINFNNKQVKGLTLTTLGVLFVIPDSLLIRLISADILTTTFWRCFFAGIVISILVLLFYRKQAQIFVKNPGINGIIFIISHGLGSLLFIASIELTSVASALFILSTSPIFAAIIGKIFLKENISFRVLITIVGALIGISIISLGSASHSESAKLGNLSALFGAILLATNLTIARSTLNFSMVPATAISKFFICLCICFFITPFSLIFADWIYLIILGVIFVPFATILIVTGPRYITAAEVSLLILLEAILAPLLVWYVLGENPGILTLFGGFIVISVLIISNIIAIRNSKEKTS
tara:strand:- start:503 stop:1390 length:888 start_codon:yes stop_codon:yes gene_type:complete